MNTLVSDDIKINKKNRSFTPKKIKIIKTGLISKKDLEEDNKKLDFDDFNNFSGIGSDMLKNKQKRDNIDLKKVQYTHNGLGSDQLCEDQKKEDETPFMNFGKRVLRKADQVYNQFRKK